MKPLIANSLKFRDTLPRFISNGGRLLHRNMQSKTVIVLVKMTMRNI